jgi:transposase
MPPQGPINERPATALSFFVGIDWAARSHELCVVDDAGAITLRFAFAHSERGINDALARLKTLGAAGDLPVAIERTNGLLVERLLEPGHPVVPVHPNAFAAAIGTAPVTEASGKHRAVTFRHACNTRVC